MATEQIDGWLIKVVMWVGSGVMMLFGILLKSLWAKHNEEIRDIKKSMETQRTEANHNFEMNKLDLKDSVGRLEDKIVDTHNRISDTHNKIEALDIRAQNRHLETLGLIRELHADKK